MISLRQHFLLATLTACLILPSQAFGQIAIKLKDDGSAQINGSITAKDKQDKVRNNPCKIYTVDLVGNNTYQIDMTTNSKKITIDPYLRLEDSNGKELASDDDGGGFPNARIIFKAPQDGKYRIIATTFAGGTGPFALKIKKTGDAPPAAKAGKAIEIALADGKVEVKAALDKDDPKDKIRTQSVSKVYTIKLIGGKSYQIDMMSKDLDSYLRLEDSTGKELAIDDDSGGELNARIVFDAPADGSYRIIATTYGGGATGNFVLTVVQK